MATGKQLMKEIYDQFLLCKICYEIYRRPKTLSCLHTFCADCIEKHNDAEYERSYRYMLYSRSITCPICRKKTEVPSGGIRRLPDNFLVANLADVVSRRKPSEIQECEICKPNIPSKHKLAKSKCLDCGKLLCRFCEELHRKTKVTKNHSLFDIEVERDIECKAHQDEVVRFYCEPCEACICVVCTFQEHKGHEISSFSDGMQKYQKSLDTIVTMCRDRIATVKQQIDLITNCETVIKNAEEQIRDMAIDSISEIRKNERKLVDNLHEVYGEDTFQFLKAKEPLKETLENLQNTCNLTDIISKDRRIELLLLRGEIQDKVNNLLGNELSEPPLNVMKQVKFVPGRLDFGYLDVQGQPVGADVQQVQKHRDTGTTECQTDIITFIERATLTERLMFDLSQNKVTQTFIIETKDSATNPIIAASPKIRSRFTMTSPVNVENCQTMTPPIAINQAHTQTPNIQMIDSCCNTNNSGFSFVLSDTKFTNTPCSPIMVDRGTVTKQKYYKDKLLDTRGLVILKDSETKMIDVIFKDGESMTEQTATNNQSTLTARPTNAEKCTLTPRTPTYERPTMTNTVFTFDVGITTALTGIDKAVATKAIVTVDSSYGDGCVHTLDQNIGTHSVHIPEMKDSETMYDQVLYMEMGSETDAILQTDSNTCTEAIQTADTSLNTDILDYTDTSVETDILGEVIQLEKDKDEKLHRLIEHCVVKGISSSVLSNLLLKYNVIMHDSCTNTEGNMWTDTTSVSMSSLAESELEFYDVENAMDTNDCDTPMKSLCDSATSTNHNVPMCDQATSMDHNVHICDQTTSTGHNVHICEQTTSTEHNVHMSFQTTSTDVKTCESKDEHVQTFVETKEVGILKRPLTVSTGVSTKKFKMCSQETETEIVSTVNQETSTSVLCTETAIDPIVFSSISKCQGTETVALTDNSSGSDVCSYTERGCSPIRFNISIDQGSDPIPIPTSDVSVTVKAITDDSSTETNVVHLTETGVSPFKIQMVNKAVSPIYNLIPKRNTGTSTIEMDLSNRASSPVKWQVEQKGVNTAIVTTHSRCLSPVKFLGTDMGVMVLPETENKGIEIKVETCETATETKRIRTLNKSIGMDQILYSEKETSTVHIHTINKMVSTDNISCADKNTMTFDVTAAYKNHVHPIAPLTVNRGTNTNVVNTSTNATLTDRQFFTEKASSPVRVITVNKGVMANKAQLMEPKEKFQTTGLITKPIRPIADSPKSNLESIEELRESDEEHCSKEIQTETPPRSPKVMFGRKAISALDLSQSASLNHKEKFVVSNPRIGRQQEDQSTFSSLKLANSKLVCKVATATNTKDVGVENKGTSTPPIETEDKAVCTEAIHVTKDDKMVACISKLQTVKQRLEQHPVYVQAPTKSGKTSPGPPSDVDEPVPDSGSSSLQTSKSADSVSSLKTSLEGKPKSAPKSISEFLAKHRKSVKSETNDDNLKFDNYSADAEKLLEPLVSPMVLRRTLMKQDSSDDSEDSHSKLKHSLARKKKPALAQLLARSSSLPEQDSLPSTIPKPKLRTIVPHVIPKLNVEEITSPRMSRKGEASANLPPKARQRKLSPVAKSSRIKPVLSGMPAFGSTPSAIIPMTPEKQKARQERLAKLRKDKQAKATLKGSGSPVIDAGLTSSRPLSPPQKYAIRGGKPKSPLQSILAQEDSSSSSS